MVYAAIKQHIYSREHQVLHTLYPALLTILPVVDKNPATESHCVHLTEMDNILAVVITNAITANDLTLRRTHTKYIERFIECLGMSSVRHLKLLVELVNVYLEVYDGPEEQSRFNALAILRALLHNAWPRVPGHCYNILKGLLMLYQDLAFTSSSTPASVKERLLAEASACIGLLQKLCPDVLTYLSGVSETKDLSDITTILHNQSLVS